MAIKDLQESRLLQCIAQKQDPDIGPQSAAHLARACQETLAAAAGLARAKVQVARSELSILVDEAEAAESSVREAEAQVSFILAELLRDDVNFSTLLMPNMVPDYREPPPETSTDRFMPCPIKPYACNSDGDEVDQFEECFSEVGEQVDVRGAKGGETM